MTNSKRVKLTDRFLKAMVAPTDDRVEVYDTERTGLRIRLYPSGRMTWLYQKQIKGGQRRALTLGQYPNLSLAAARALALSIEAEAELGVDRVELQAEARRKAEEEALAARTLADILEIYVVNHIHRNLKAGNSRTEREVQLRTHLQPLLASRIDSVRRADLQRIVDKKAAEGKVTMANRLRAAFTAFFGWAMRRNHIESNPAEGLQNAGKEQPRERTPTVVEVQEIWRASFALGDLWGPFLRLCILTGQRSRSDILAMKWDWVDLDRSRFEIPLPKNSMRHIVHLSAEAIAELKVLKDGQKNCPSKFVFTTTGRSASSGVGNAKEKLDKIIAQARADANLPMMEKWVIHDLRRAQATALAEAGFDEGVVDRIQNHVASSSRASAVARVYNKAEKLPERARALNAWADMVMGRWGDIVQLPLQTKDGGASP